MKHIKIISYLSAVFLFLTVLIMPNSALAICEVENNKIVNCPFNAKEFLEKQQICTPFLVEREYVHSEDPEVYKKLDVNINARKITQIIF